MQKNHASFSTLKTKLKQLNHISLISQISKVSCASFYKTITLYKGWGKTEHRVEIDIFVNPSSSDIAELKETGVNYIRFIVTKNNKKIYVWNGELEVHANVSSRLEIDDSYKGEAEIKGRHLIHPVFYFYLRKDEDGWLQTYFRDDIFANEPLSNASFYDSINIKAKGGPVYSVNVYVNPTRLDIKELKEFDNATSLRFIAVSKTKKLYVWPSDEAMHLNMANKLQILPQDSMAGTAGISGYELEAIEIDRSCYNMNMDLNKYKWVEKYIPDIMDAEIF